MLRRPDLKALPLLILTLTLSGELIGANFAPIAHADFISRCGDSLMRHLKAPIVNLLGLNQKFQTVTRVDFKLGKKFELRLGDRVGTGWYGTVYDLNRIDHPFLSGPPQGTEWVVKFPHCLELGNKAYTIGITCKALQREEESRLLLEKNISRIEASPLFPKYPHWKSGALPLIPTLLSIPFKDDSKETLNREPLLVKLKAKGLGPKELYEKYGTLLPVQMEESMNELFSLIQAIYDSVPFDERSGYSVDARPDNAIWIEDPTMMKEVGFIRPGFIYVEMDQALGNVPQYIESKGKTTSKEYWTEFLKYVKAEGKRSP